MAKLTRKQLKKLYPLADEDYLVAMVEGKVHVVNYINQRKAEVKLEFDKYMKRIRNVFNSYFIKKKRDYIDSSDVGMLKKWHKEVDTILKEYFKWNKLLFITSVSELYNYKRLYNLWMLSKISGAPEDDYDKPVAAEADKTRGVTDPGFTKDKLDGIVNHEVYGSTYDERTSTALENALNALDANMSGYVSGDPKDVTKMLTSIEKTLRKEVANKAANAISLGLEDAEEFSDYDVFSSNPFFGGNYQRVEVLDRKTCLVCAALDGTVYKHAVGRVHPNCRGLDIPIPETVSKSQIREMGSKQRRRESFDNWFEGLPEDQKKSVLGKTKYEKYVAGSLNIHDVVKQNRVLGVKEVEAIESYKSIPSIKTDLSVATKVIKSEAQKLPQRRIEDITTREELNAYYRFVNKKEAIYQGIQSNALTKANVHRNTLKAEINRERRILRLKEKEIALAEKTKA